MKNLPPLVGMKVRINPENRSYYECHMKLVGNDVGYIVDECGLSDGTLNKWKTAMDNGKTNPYNEYHVKVMFENGKTIIIDYRYMALIDEPCVDVKYYATTKGSCYVVEGKENKEFEDIIISKGADITRIEIFDDAWREGILNGTQKEGPKKRVPEEDGDEMDYWG